MHGYREKALIVGAGLAGSVLARRLAEAGLRCHVIDRREHVAGLCYSSRDEETGIEVHRFGPHTFHTSSQRVWEWVRRFDEWHECVACAMCTHSRGVFSLPVNLHSINQLYGVCLSPAQARAFIETRQDKSIACPANAEEQLLRFVGPEIYETFFRDYSAKQWGTSLRELSPDIVKRIPIRFNYDRNYYCDTWQGYPRHGYTALVRNMLSHPGISLGLGTGYDKGMAKGYGHVFYSGPIDEYFDYAYGELGYRTVDFRYERGKGDMLGCSWMNYTDMSVPWTRAHEHKCFSPWEKHELSVTLYEYSREAGRHDDRFYPKRMAGDLERLAQYAGLAEGTPGVSFIGRLGCYRYLDMHRVIEDSLAYADRFLRWLDGREPGIPRFSAPPLG